MKEELSMTDKRFAKKINDKRKALGLKTEELAIMCGIEYGYMRQILTGQVPSGQLIIKLCEVLQLSPNYLFDFVEDCEDKEIIQALNQLSVNEKQVVLNLLNTYIQMHDK